MGKLPLRVRVWEEESGEKNDVNKFLKSKIKGMKWEWCTGTWD